MPPSRTSRCLSVAAALAAGAAVGWAFFPTLRWMAGRWAADPQYSHGFLVPPAAAYFLWRKADGSVSWAGTPRPLVGAVALTAAAGLRFLAGGLFFHQLDAAALLLTLLGLAVAAGGWTLLGRVAPAVLFLLFMVPLPYELERDVGGPLKVAATRASTFLLQTLGYPALADGTVILVDDARLGVADACSGLKMLLTFAAFAAGAALLLDRHWFEKLAVLLGVVPIAVLVNALRVTATGVARVGVPDPDTFRTLHDLFGWLMMPAGLALLAAELWALDRLVVRPPPPADPLLWAAPRPDPTAPA